MEESYNAVKNEAGGAVLDCELKTILLKLFLIRSFSLICDAIFTRLHCYSFITLCFNVFIGSVVFPVIA